jgi:hypothetical protein
MVLDSGSSLDSDDEIMRLDIRHQKIRVMSVEVAVDIGANLQLN